MIQVFEGVAAIGTIEDVESVLVIVRIIVLKELAFLVKFSTFSIFANTPANFFKIHKLFLSDYVIIY